MKDRRISQGRRQMHKLRPVERKFLLIVGFLALAFWSINTYVMAQGLL